MINKQGIQELSDDNDYNGSISDLIKIVKACQKANLDIKDIMNVLRRPDKKVVLEELNKFQGRTEIQRQMEELKAREERARDFGIGE